MQANPIPHGLSWGRIILSSIGAILFGLGVILLFTYNWEAMPKAAKPAVVRLIDTPENQGLPDSP